MAQKILQRTLTIAAESQMKAQAKMADRLGQLLYVPMTLDQVENVLRTAVEALVLIYHTPFTTPPTTLAHEKSRLRSTKELQESTEHPPVGIGTITEEDDEAESGLTDGEHQGSTKHIASLGLVATSGEPDAGAGRKIALEEGAQIVLVSEEKDDGAASRPLVLENELAAGLDNVVRTMPLYENQAVETMEQMLRLERQLTDLRDQMDEILPFVERFPKLEVAVRQVKRNADMMERESSLQRRKRAPDAELKAEIEKLQERIISLEHRHEESVGLAKERVRKLASDVQAMGPKLTNAMESLGRLQLESKDAVRDISNLKETTGMIEVLAASAAKRREGGDSATMTLIRDMEQRLNHTQVALTEHQRGAQLQHDSLLTRVNNTAATLRELWENVEKDGEEAVENLSQMTGRINELEKKMSALPSASELQQQISDMVEKVKAGLEEEGEKRTGEMQATLDEMRSHMNVDVDRLWAHAKSLHDDLLTQHTSCNDKVNKILLPAVANLQDELRTLFSLKAETRDLWDEMKRIRSESDELPATLRGELSPAVEKNVLMSIEHRLASLDNARVAYMHNLQLPLRPDELSAAPPMLSTASRVPVKCLSCDHTAYVPARGSLENCRCGIPLPPPILQSSQSLPVVTSAFPPSSNQAAQSLFRHEIERRNVSSRGQRVAMLRQRHEKVLGMSALKGGGGATPKLDTSIQREYPAGGDEKREANTLFSQLTRTPVQRPHTAPHEKISLVVSIPDIRIHSAIEKL